MMIEHSSASELAPQPVQLRDGDVVLPVEVYRTDTSGRLPAVVVAPGGLTRGNLDAYRWAGERLAASGYAALVLTYRAPAPYDDAADVTLAVDWLERDAGVDAGRLAVLGHSRGGMAALRASADDPRVRAVASIAAVVDTADYVRRVAGFAPAARDGVMQFMGGAPEAIPDRYEAVRVLSFAGRIRQPVLLIHGAADMRVPLDHSVRLESALREAGNERVHLETVEGMGHSLELATLGYQFDRVVGLTTTWLTEMLG